MGETFISGHQLCAEHCADSLGPASPNACDIPDEEGLLSRFMDKDNEDSERLSTINV